MNQTMDMKVTELINEFPINLRRGLVAITLNTTVADEDSLTESKELAEEQYVLSVGELVRGLKPGDFVGLNISALTKVRRVIGDSDQTISEIDIKTFEVGDEIVGIVDERVIEYIYK